MTDKIYGYKMMLVASILSLAFLSSCIFDDLSWCPPRGLKLIFTYTHNSHGKDLFPEAVDYLNLYIYDTLTGDLLVNKQLAREDLENQNELFLELSEGAYRLVVWGNMATHDYLLQNQDDHNNMLLSLIVDPSLQVTKKPKHLFHGTDLLVMPKYSSTMKPVEQKIELIKNTNDIKISLANKLAHVPIPSPDEFTLLISGSNGEYNFDNSPASTSPLLQYIPQTKMEGGKPVYEFRSLRLFDNDDTNLSIIDSKGNLVFSHHLSGLLLTKLPYINNNSDLDRYDDYSLEIEVFRKADDSYIVSSIKVNGWGATPQPATM